MTNNKLIFLISFIISISILGIMFPYGFPLYSIMVLMVFFYIFLIKKNIIIFERSLIVLYILEVIYLWGQLNTYTMYVHTLIDITNIIIINLTIIIFVNSIKTKEDFRKLYFYLQRIVFIFGIVVSLIGLYKFTLLLNGAEPISFFVNNDKYPWGTSLISDYNFFSLGLFLPILFGYSFFRNSNSLLFKIFLIHSILLMITTIILSGSRRGLVIIAIILLFWVFKSIFSKYKLNFTTIKNKFAYILVIAFTLITMNNLNPDMFDNIYEFEKLNYRVETILNTTEEDNVFSEREIRFVYAGELINNYSLFESLFGNGFEYLELYNKKFGEVAGEGYPHNIIISHMLFSGVIGVIFLFLLYYQVVILYFKYRKNINILFIFFFIATIFKLTSGNSIFSLKLYLIIIILPFIYHKISKFDENKNNLNSIKQLQKR